MNGAHDLGGKHGFGPIDFSQTENFTHQWEESVFGLTLTCGMLGQWNLDESRYARECTDPVHYLSSTYYEHWLHGLELLLVKKGLITADELISGKAASNTTLQSANPEKVQQIIDSGAPTELPEQQPNRFTLNQTVVVKPDNPIAHTRIPGYVRGVHGTICKLHGAHIFADEHAKTGIKVPEHLYNVRFEGKDIWGSDAEPNSCVLIDLFEPYLISVAEYQRSLSN